MRSEKGGCKKLNGIAALFREQVLAVHHFAIVHAVQERSNKT